MFIPKHLLFLLNRRETSSSGEGEIPPNPHRRMFLYEMNKNQIRIMHEESSLLKKSSGLRMDFSETFFLNIPSIQKSISIMKVFYDLEMGFK